MPLHLLWLIIPIPHYKTTLHSPAFLCNPDEICRLISRIPIDTASGPDDISSIMLHNTAPIIFYLISSSPIFNSSLSIPFRLEKLQCHTYFQMENLFFIPFRLSPNISTFTPSKILKHHIFNYLYEYCSAHNILSNCLGSIVICKAILNK